MNDATGHKRAVVQQEFGDETRPANRPPVAAGTIPWSTHLLAWDGYAAAGHGSQSAERIHERGGFGYYEIQCALAGHYNSVARCTVVHPPVPGWEPRR